MGRVRPRDTVRIEVEKGLVTLTGQVDWNYQKEAAELDVRRLAGVIGVSNLIKIKPGLSPSNISDDIMRALHRSWLTDPKTIKVSVEGNLVRLTGTVHSWQERLTAASAAWAAPGVIELENDITIV